MTDSIFRDAVPEGCGVEYEYRCGWHGMPRAPAKQILGKVFDR